MLQERKDMIAIFKRRLQTFKKGPYQIRKRTNKISELTSTITKTKNSIKGLRAQETSEKKELLNKNIGQEEMPGIKHRETEEWELQRLEREDTQS